MNLQAAAALLRGLTGNGVRRAVMSPGSRSSPLALAADRSPLIETVVLPDERSAAFFALGQARAERLPVIVVATSGTAPANWYPAVIEASMDGVPLILISADRPPELLHTGANQAIDQDRMFAGYPRDFVQLPAPDGESTTLFESAARRAAEKALWPRPGPVHINIAFREPLLPSSDDPKIDWPARAGEPPTRPDVRMRPSAARHVAEELSGRPGVLVCGRDDYPTPFAERVTALAEKLDCPVIADPLSGLRWGGHDRSRIVTTGDLIRADDMKTDWVIQFGASPTSRNIQTWLAAQGDRLMLTGPFGPWSDPAHGSLRMLRSDPLQTVERLLETDMEPCPEGWMARWTEQEHVLTELCRKPDCSPPEADLIRFLEDGLPAGATLFIGNSMPVRSLDTFARGRKIPMRALGNRGASGIDGCVSTVAGLAACSGPTVGLLGDLSLYHDMNGLLAARQTSATIIVINNGGGAIFGLLPPHRRPEFERLWLTPTNLDLRRVAHLYDIPYATLEPGASLLSAIETASADTACARLIEVRVDAQSSWERHRRLREAAAAL